VLIAEELKERILELSRKGAGGDGADKAGDTVVVPVSGQGSNSGLRLIPAPRLRLRCVIKKQATHKHPGGLHNACWCSNTDGQLININPSVSIPAAP